MDIINEHFKIKEYNHQLSAFNKEVILLQCNLNQLKSKLINESRLLASSLCLLLHINEDDYGVAHLLSAKSMNNQQAISQWALAKLVEAGFPYESCPIKSLATSLELKLNHLLLN
ncbi:MAG: hypothetical protein ACPG5R_07245 [Cognaticolwellia aestuarii]|tara:strand:- start:5722 stop:6066 length:345 start_codon:yes stop_codon:yes gene_type:complete